MLREELRLTLRQILIMTKSNMMSRYRKTIAGFIWVVMNPIIMYAVQSFVFRKLLKIAVPNYALFLLSGLLPWIFITMTIDMVTPVLDLSNELLKSFKMNPVVLVCSQVLDNFFNFLFAFFVVLIPSWFFMGGDWRGLILLPPILFSLLLFVGSACWFLSTLQVFFKDVKFVVSFIFSILFFLTPIFYPIDYIPESYRFLVKLNPIYAQIEPFRFSIYNFNFEELVKSMLRAYAYSTTLVAMAFFYWRKKKNEFYLSL